MEIYHIEDVLVRKKILDPKCSKKKEPNIIQEYHDKMLHIKIDFPPDTSFLVIMIRGKMV